MRTIEDILSEIPEANIFTVESANIARPFMLRTLLSETVWLYLWSSISIFTTPVDFVLHSPENTNLHVSSPQFGGNFEFNTIRKNPNIFELNCECNLCQMRTCYVSKFSLFDNIAKLTHYYILGINHSCAMLGDKFDSEISVGWPISKWHYTTITEIHRSLFDVFAFHESVATALRNYDWVMFLKVPHATFKT